MRWDQQSGGWILRIGFTDQKIANRFAGLVYPLSGHRWLAEVFGKDLAESFAEQSEAMKWVEDNR